MIKPINRCTDEELVAIVRSTSPTGRFAVERADALKEMGERVAHQCISNAQARRRTMALRRKFDAYAAPRRD